MARNQEKALTLFNRWETFKTEFHSKDANVRPLADHEVSSLPDAEKRRRDIIREITRKLFAIQNATLGEPKLRELNDEMNKLMKKKYFLETKIRELGGVVNKAKQYYDIEGVEIPGVRGYKYYGAAKQLPGVREQLAAAAEEKEEAYIKRTRGDIYKGITPDYYGFRDEDGGDILAKEAVREEELREEESARYQEELDKAIAAAGSTGGSLRLTDREKGVYEEFIRSNNEMYADDDEDVYLQLQARGLLASSSAVISNSNSSNSKSSNSSNSSNSNSNSSEAMDISYSSSAGKADDLHDFLLEQKKKALLQLI